MIDSKSKIRLIVVSVVLLGAIGYMVFTTSLSSYSLYKKIDEVKGDSSLVGKNIEVGGKVQPGSIVRNGSEISFAVTENASVINVSYKGQVPQTFGDNVQAVIKGKLVAGDKLEAKSIVTKCPSKYDDKDVKDMKK